MLKTITLSLIMLSKLVISSEAPYESTPLHGKLNFDIHSPEMRKIREKGFFSQVGEDLILSMVFSDKSTGTYVDVGAHHYQNINVCHRFYLQGWRGINIEPQPTFFELLQQYRSEDINLQNLIGNENGRTLLFELSDPRQAWVTALSTPCESVAKHLERTRNYQCQSYECEMITLNQVLENHLLGRNIDFLKIDVEGYELNVLEGVDLTKFRPTVIVIEVLSPKGAYGYKDWGHILFNNEYKLVFADRLNFYYVKKEAEDTILRFSTLVSEIQNFLES